MEILLSHNPYMSRMIHGCRMRLVVNTYVGCPHRCHYCYMYSYTKLSDILNPRSKKEFEKRLEKDIKEYIVSGKEKYLVYVSSNCEAFHPSLEGVKHVVSKCLRLASGIKKLYPSSYDRLKLCYMANGYMESRSVWVLRDDVMEKLNAIQVYESCKKHGIALFTCMDNVKLSGIIGCDGCEEVLKLRFIRNQEDAVKDEYT